MENAKIAYGNPKGLGAPVISPEALKKAEEKKGVVKDIFAITPLEVIDAKAEDLEAAKEKRLKEDLERSTMAANVAQFTQQIFTIMAGLMERREKARGLSQKNVSEAEAQIRDYLGRPQPVGSIAKTAYIMAATKAKEGITNPETLIKDLEDKRLVGPNREGAISCNGRRFALTFEPMDEHRVAVLQALRERFGEAERIEKQERKQETRDLLATGELTVWQVFAGKPGKFSLYRPFEKVERKVQGENRTFVFKPGVIAGESDGQRITFAAGTGGCEEIVKRVHEAGLALAVKTLNDEDFWTKKDELRPLIAVHRTLWSIRRIAEAQGQGPMTEITLGEMGKDLMAPEKFFSSKDEGKTMIVFDEKDKEGRPKPWRQWDDKGGTMRDGDKRYNPIYNFAAVLVRDSDDKVFWADTLPHLDSVFKEALNKPLETEDGKKVVFGAPAALYSWAKRKYSQYSPTATPPEAPVPEAPSPETPEAPAPETPPERPKKTGRAKK